MSRRKWDPDAVSDVENQLRLTAELVRQRKDLGDRAAVPRKVDHSATFRGNSDAAAAAETIAALGYEVSLRRGWLKSRIEFSRVTAVDEDSAEAFTREVVHVIEAHAGSYDGWGPLPTD